MTSANCRCLGCGSPLREPFLDLGKTPLANSYVKPENAQQPEPVHPLAVTYCPHCHLMQLTHPVNPEILFNDYVYLSSFSETFLEHARFMAEELSKRFRLDKTSFVMEIASNDGYLLQHFVKKGIPVIGIEPARNVAEGAQRKGIPTINCFFGPDAVDNILNKCGPADLVIGNNVLAHVPAINDFLSAVKACLKPAGMAVFEFPYLKELLDKTEFDTIYHEHVFYYSLSSIKPLAERAGLELFDVIHQHIHGGSLRIFLQHKRTRTPLPAVEIMLDQERKAGLTTPECYKHFNHKVTHLKESLLALLQGLKAKGKRVAAYGAPAKGNTLLNYCGIGQDLVEFTVDRNPHKQGLLLPGTHIPIGSPEKIEERRPDYVLILPWNLKEEIIKQMAFIRRWGGKFMVAVPKPEIL